MAKAAASPEAVLRLLLKRTRRPVPLFSTLATVSEETTACARTVVVREVDPEAATLWLSTHAKADKVRHLRQQPVAELVLWLDDERLQVRLRATWRIIDAPAAARSPKLAAQRAAAWRTHSEKSRTMFTWPAPGQPLTPALSRQLRDTHNTALFAATPPPDFAILLGSIDQMDALSIGERIHRRYLHERTRQKWKTSPITP